MKKRSTLIIILVLTVTMGFLFTASGAKAETSLDDTKSLAAILNLKTASPIGQKITSAAETVSESRTLKQVYVSVNNGVDAFLDLKSPYPQEPIRTKSSRDDMRAVVGFHFLIR